MMQEISTARALEIVLSRCKMDNETARILKTLLAVERQKYQEPTSVIENGLSIQNYGE